MRRSFLNLLSILLVSGVVFGLDVPRLKGRVNDLAGILAAEQVQQLEGKLASLEQTESTQIVILVIPGLEGEALEDYSHRVATTWKLGQRGTNNGALLLVALKERKVRIEIAYGLEEKLTDARSRRIIQEEILPHFRQGHFYDGIDAGITALIQTVQGTYQPTARAPTRTARSGRSGDSLFHWIVFLLVPLLAILRSMGMWGGGIIGAGAGSFLASRIAGGLVPGLVGGFFGLILGGVIGAAIRAAGGPNSAGRSGIGGPWISSGGFSGFSGGGGDSGGGSSGFSGGGGDFGGGGSSGSW